MEDPEPDQESHHERAGLECEMDAVVRVDVELADAGWNLARSQMALYRSYISEYDGELKSPA